MDANRLLSFLQQHGCALFWAYHILAGFGASVVGEPFFNVWVDVHFVLFFGPFFVVSLIVTLAAPAFLFRLIYQKVFAGRTFKILPQATPDAAALPIDPIWIVFTAANLASLLSGFLMFFTPYHPLFGDAFPVPPIAAALPFFALYALHSTAFLAVLFELDEAIQLEKLIRERTEINKGEDYEHNSIETYTRTPRQSDHNSHGEMEMPVDARRGVVCIPRPANPHSRRPPWRRENNGRQ